MTQEEAVVASVAVREVQSKRDQKEFIEFPKSLYSNSREWVPLFDADMKAILARKTPYFDRTPAIFVLAEQGGQTVGRAMASVRERYNQQHDVHCIHFYFVDFVDDKAVSAAVFASMADWGRDQGMECMIGPMLTTGVVGGGILIKGFEYKAAMTMMPYHFPYYRDHFEAAGFTKRFDLLSLHIDPKGFSIPERMERAAERVRQRGRMAAVEFQSRRHMRRFADGVVGLYNPTLADHPENNPLSDAELTFLVNDIMTIAEPDLEKVITYDGKVIGFCLTFPDLTDALQKNRGKLGPIRIVRLLRARKRPTRLIGNGMGIDQQYRRLGGNALLYSELVRTVRSESTGGTNYSFDAVELLQVNETTDMMLSDLKTMGATELKRHRVYELTIR